MNAASQRLESCQRHGFSKWLAQTGRALFYTTYRKRPDAPLFTPSQTGTLTVTPTPIAGKDFTILTTGINLESGDIVSKPLTSLRGKEQWC
jgi:hypothetical protein